MKKLIAILMMLAAVPAMAQHRHHGHHGHHHRHHYDWVTPMVVGGVITYVLTRPQPVIQQQPVIVQPTGPVCTEWREIRYPNGTVVMERTCYQQ